MDYINDPRFQGLKPFENKIWLSSPTMHGDEQKWVDEAIRTNWVSTVGENINVIEEQVAGIVGRKYAVALASGTAALHLAIRLCAEKLYGQPPAGQGSLAGKKVFASDMTFAATVNPICYEGGTPVFIDSEYETWNMDPKALEKAFKKYPDVKLIVMAHLYGSPAKIDEIRKIADRHGALIVEDAAESFGATYKGKQTGCFGDVSILSGNGNKIITGSSGGFLLTDSEEDANRVRKWSTQSREAAPWYQHEELGYNYRMSNIIAGILRGQLPYLEEHIEQKRQIYRRYKEGLKDLPVTMNPFDEKNSKPNYWLSCILIDPKAMCRTVRSDKDELWISEQGTSCPGEILAALKSYNAEGRPIWKPMHLQPIYRNQDFVVAEKGKNVPDAGADIFQRGVCLPSDNKMTKEEQDIVIDIVHRCFE